MIYCFPQNADSKTKYLTYVTVRKVLESRGHEIVGPEDMDRCDAVLVSICDVTEVNYLKRTKQGTTKPVIVGGAFAFNYWSAKVYSDVVWIGEIFGLAELKSLDEIMESPHAYTGDDTKQLITAEWIDWERVPIAQIRKTNAYYLGGVGCKNNCSFCLTSWTHRHQKNDPRLIAAAQRECKKRKIYLMTVSNEYDYDDKNRTKDMLLTDYIKIPVRGSLIRCGVEFATEENRRRHGKPITKDELYKAIQKMEAERIAMRLFHISGFDTLAEWEEYINEMGWMLEKVGNGRIMHLMFNNLQYQNYTPLYDYRRQIDPGKYIDFKVTKRWYDKLRTHSKHILVGPPSPFHHVAARMGVELSNNREQQDFWLYASNHRDKFTTLQIYDKMFETGILDTPKRMLNFKTGEIKIYPDRKV